MIIMEEGVCMTVPKIGDFDIDIGEVYLVHKCIFEKKYKSTDYKYGRLVSGVVFCISGSAEYDFDGKKLILSPGELIYLPASSAYTIKTLGDEQFFHITANFEVKKTDSLSYTVFSEIARGRMRFTSSKENTAYFKDLTERLVLVWQNKKYGYRVLARSLIYEILFTYFSDAANFIRSTDDYGRILPAKTFLDEQYMTNTPVKELASLCNLSETHFRRLFVKLFGISPTDYRLNKRILKAKDLLLSGDFSVSDTSFAVGFDDANYFSRIFKKHTGITPGALLKSGIKANTSDNIVVKK